MKVRIPEEIPGGSDLKVIPEGLYTAMFKDAIVKKSKSSGQPMVIIRWILNSEPSDPEVWEGQESFPTVGETVLDTYSLQEQALWRLNDVHKELLGSNIPASDYEMEDIQNYFNEAFAGQEAHLLLINEASDKGEMRTKVDKVSKI